MPFVPPKVKLVAALPSVRVAWLALAGTGCALPLFPLLGQPGYEFSVTLAALHGLFGGVLGAAAVARAQPTRAPVGPYVTAALLLSLSALVPPLLVATLSAFWGTACDPFAQIAFVPVVAVPSSVLAVATGALCRTFFRSSLGAALAYAALVFLSLGVTVFPILTGPQVFAYNHFLGFLPGPLYDEALQVSGALLWFRLATLSWALGYLGLATRRSKAALAGFAMAFGLELASGPLGFRSSDARVEEALGATRQTEHFRLVYPREKNAADVERWVRDLEFRHQQLTDFLGGDIPGTTTVWLYRSAEEKQRLTGAARTQFAKPWRREVHVNDSKVPHDIIKHELVHALAAPLGRPPFGVTAQGFGLVPLAGLIEGFAVAGDNPVDELTLHQWASGMKKSGLLPELSGLFSKTGFFAAAPSRAYTAAGSFIRHLGDTRGQTTLRDLYRDGDFVRVYGVDVGTLSKEWLAFLDAQTLGEDEEALAFARFRKGSLFQRACAREVASLSQAAANVHWSDPAEAARLYGRCAALQPNEPQHVLAQSSALERAGDVDSALSLLSTWSAAAGAMSPTVRADFLLAQADLEASRDRWAEAEAHLQQVVDLKVSSAVDRTARIKLEALRNEAVRAALLAYFKKGSDDVKLYVLREALERAPHVGAVRYLLGRRLVQAGQPALGLAQLLEARRLGLPRSIDREAQRLESEARYAMGDCDGLATMKADEWHARCTFETKHFGDVAGAKDALR